MKRSFLSILSFFVTVGLVITLEACNVPETDSQNPLSVLTQEEIEQLAILSLDETLVDADFSFETQRQVTLDFRFHNIQYATPISIYSTYDPSTQMPLNLLEKGTLLNSNRYRGNISVSYTIDSLIIVLNDDVSSAVEVTIDLNDQAQYSFW